MHYYTSFGSSAPLPLQCGHIVFLVYFTCISFPLYKSSNETLSFIVMLGPVLSCYYLYLYINKTCQINIWIYLPSSSKEISEKIKRMSPSLLHSLFINTFFTTLIIFSPFVWITENFICRWNILKFFQGCLVIWIFIRMM